MKKKSLETGIVGIALLLLFSATNFFVGLSEGAQDSSSPELRVEKIPSDQPDKKDPQRTKPVLPPTADPDMVVKPNVPTDPDAVVTPPVVDPEMAVDPASGERLTPEKLEQLTPEALEKEIPDQKRREK